MHLTVEARIKNIVPLTEFVNRELEKMGCSLRARTQIDIALDELFSNICRYAYKDKVGYATVRVEEVPDQNAARITLEDEGVPFDPLSHEDPDTSLGLHDRGIGGLGILLVKKTMNEVNYEYRDGANVFTVVKSI